MPGVGEKGGPGDKTKEEDVMDFIAIDFETANPNLASICQLAQPALKMERQLKYGRH